MISQRLANLIFAVILLAAVGYLAHMAWGFQTNPFGDATLPTKFFPLFLLGAIALFILIYAFEYLTKGQSGQDAGQVFFDSFGGFLKSVLTILVVVGAYFIWRNKGLGIPLDFLLGDGARLPSFAIAGIVLPLATSVAMGNRNLLQLGILFVATILIYLAFRYGLNVTFG